MQDPAAGPPLTIAIDAMGGDRGPGAVVAALAKTAEAFPELRFLVCGPRETLGPLLKRRGALADRIELRHAARVVAMADKPSAALRAAEGTSMWTALDAVGQGAAQAAVSCGNTGRAPPQATPSCSTWAPTCAPSRTTSRSSPSWAPSTPASRSTWRARASAF